MARNDLLSVTLCHFRNLLHFYGNDSGKMEQFYFRYCWISFSDENTDMVDNNKLWYNAPTETGDSHYE